MSKTKKKMPTESEIDAARRSPQYAEGREAFESGVDVDECPRRGDYYNRVGWLTGWYDGRTESRLGDIFDRWGLVWP